MKRFVLLIAILIIFITACSKKNDTKPSFTSISMSEAKDRMEKEEGYIIVDVRTEEEFNEGHIPGAVLIPNESIGDEIPELNDKNQLIFVYCRSGNRSKQAASKMVGLGYTNVVEIGGIIDWDGEIAKQDE